jgi:hypothetical protein
MMTLTKLNPQTLPRWIPSGAVLSVKLTRNKKMSRLAINQDRLNDHLTLSECHPDSECRINNWWLYDDRAGMNIGMRKITRDAALVAAVEYWAKRAIRAEKDHSQLRSQVDLFVSQFVESDEDEDNH